MPHPGVMEEAVAVETIPFDPRFPNCNQTLACYTNYCDYYRCKDLLDNDNRCEYLKKMFTTMCPHAWVTKWDEQRAAGTFPNPIVRVPKDYCEKLAAKKKKTQNS